MKSTLYPESRTHVRASRTSSKFVRHLQTRADALLSFYIRQYTLMIDSVTLHGTEVSDTGL